MVAVAAAAVVAAVTMSENATIKTLTKTNRFFLGLPFASLESDIGHEARLLYTSVLYCSTSSAVYVVFFLPGMAVPCEVLLDDHLSDGGCIFPISTSSGNLAWAFRATRVYVRTDE